MIDISFWKEVAAEWRTDNDGTNIVPVKDMPSIPDIDGDDDFNNVEIEDILSGFDL